MSDLNFNLNLQKLTLIEKEKAKTIEDIDRLKQDLEYEKTDNHDKITDLELKL
jgi:hypothetical protein